MKVEGFACDQCNQFSEDQAGWLTVVAISDRQVRVEVCGPACLLKMARELVKAEAQPDELEHQAKQAVLERRRAKDRERKREQRQPGPVQCDVEGCGRSFKNEHALSMHRVRTHEGKYWASQGNGVSSADRSEAST